LITVNKSVEENQNIPSGFNRWKGGETEDSSDSEHCLNNSTTASGISFHEFQPGRASTLNCFVINGLNNISQSFEGQRMCTFTSAGKGGSSSVLIVSKYIDSRATTGCKGL